MKKNAITYNYLIYVLTCLVVVLLMRTFKFTDVETKWEFAKVSYSLFITFLSSTLAWLIGKKNNLHYFWICGMGFAGLMILASLKLLFTDVGAVDKGIITFLILAIVGIFLMAFTIFIISFPFQFLFFKLKQNFKKLE